MSSGVPRGEYLAWVDGSTLDVQGKPLSFLAPVRTALEDGQTWLPIEEAVVEAFPTRGQVIWFDAAPDAARGALWRIRLAPNPKREAQDAFRVADAGAEQAMEVVDLRALGGDREAREWALGDGIPDPVREPRRVLLWVSDEVMLGPVWLERRTGGRLIVPAAEVEQPLIVLAAELPESIVDPTGHARLVLPPRARLRRIGQRDWGPDDRVLRSAIQRLRRLDQEYARARGLTEQAVNDLVDRIGVSPDEAALCDLHRYRAQRAVEVLASRRVVDDLLADLVDVIMARPEVASRIEERSRAEVDRVLAQAHAEATVIREETRAAAETAVADRRKEAERLRQQVEALRAEVAGLGREADHLRARIAAETEELTNAVEERVLEVMEQPKQLLAEIAVLRAVGALDRASGPPSDRGSETRGSTPSMWMLDDRAPVDRSGSLADTAKLASKNARALCLDDLAARRALSALLAGGMPVAGRDGRRLFDALALALTGREPLRVHVSPAVIELGDLLGRWSPQAGTFVPDPYGLLDLLAAATSSGELFLVVLEGINLAPVDAWLLPLLDVGTGAAAGLGGRRPLPVAHPSILPPGYGNEGVLRWPGNVLLAATLAQGPASLSLPPALWSSASLVPCPMIGRVGRQRMPTAGLVMREDWESWREEVRQADTSAWEVFVADLLEEGGWLPPPEAAEFAGRYWQALSTLTGDEERACDLTAADCFAPRAALLGEGEFLLSSMDRAGRDPESCKRILDDPALRAFGR